MSRILPNPLLSLTLFLTSILLSGSVQPPSLLLGGLAALLLPFVMHVFRIPPVRVRRPGAMVKLAANVAVDVLRSNWAVARILLGGGRRERVSGFIHIPLDLRDRHGLATLAVILTMTPGTLWVDYERSSGRLLLHVLDLIDEDEWVRLIKTRYERLLMEIFE
jgi:multicomponent K+:H+ antiporter subunit E